jgi:hypothetical protein
MTEAKKIEVVFVDWIHDVCHRNLGDHSRVGMCQLSVTRSEIDI